MYTIKRLPITRGYSPVQLKDIQLLKQKTATLIERNRSEIRRLSESKSTNAYGETGSAYGKFD